MFLLIGHGRWWTADSEITKTDMDFEVDRCCCYVSNDCYLSTMIRWKRNDCVEYGSWVLGISFLFWVSMLRQCIVTSSGSNVLLIMVHIVCKNSNAILQNNFILLHTVLCESMWRKWKIVDSVAIWVIKVVIEQVVTAPQELDRKEDEKRTDERNVCSVATRFCWLCIYHLK